MKIQTDRLDVILVQRGLVESRERARRLILAGKVRVNGQVISKAGTRVPTKAQIEITEPERYVSRGGYKLEQAFRTWPLSVKGKRCLDLGASTGGFTDCLLQHGAAQVVAVDVGKGQLAWRLRQDPRVEVREGVNARYLQPTDFETLFDAIVIDCSFISLRLILPVAERLIRPDGWIVALVKPQFEVGKEIADRWKGVIRDPAIHRQVLEDLQQFVRTQTRLRWKDVVESPLPGPAGNKEFLVWLIPQEGKNAGHSAEKQVKGNEN